MELPGVECFGCSGITVEHNQQTVRPWASRYGVTFLLQCLRQGFIGRAQRVDPDGGGAVLIKRSSHCLGILRILCCKQRGNRLRETVIGAQPFFQIRPMFRLGVQCGRAAQHGVDHTCSTGFAKCFG